MLTAALAFGLAILVAAGFRTSVSGADEDVRKLADTMPDLVAQLLILASQYVGAVAAICAGGVVAQPAMARAASDTEAANFIMRRPRP